MSTKSFTKLYVQLEATPAYQAEKLAVAFLAELHAFMQRNSVTNAELARRMEVSPAYITKLFRGSSNLSLETLAKLANATGCQVHLHLADNGMHVRWFDVLQPARTAAQQAPSTNAQFAKVMQQLKPRLKSTPQELGHDQKFAFAA